MSDERGKDDGMPETPQERARLGQHLREAREYLGLSVEFVAQQAGLSRALLLAVEGGRRKVAYPDLKRLAQLLKRPVSVLLAEEDAVEGAVPDEAAFHALFRAARDLSDEDRRQVLRFAQFLHESGPAPLPPEEASGA
jgi:transcriptional regulator with XRE-family HTH domain